MIYVPSHAALVRMGSLVLLRTMRMRMRMMRVRTEKP